MRAKSFQHLHESVRVEINLSGFSFRRFPRVACPSSHAQRVYFAHSLNFRRNLTISREAHFHRHRGE